MVEFNPMSYLMTLQGVARDVAEMRRRRSGFDFHFLMYDNEIDGRGVPFMPAATASVVAMNQGDIPAMDLRAYGINSMEVMVGYNLVTSHRVPVFPGGWNGELVE